MKAYDHGTFVMRETLQKCFLYAFSTLSAACRAKHYISLVNTRIWNRKIFQNYLTPSVLKKLSLYGLCENEDCIRRKADRVILSR